MCLGTWSRCWSQSRRTLPETREPRSVGARGTCITRRTSRAGSKNVPIGDVSRAGFGELRRLARKQIRARPLAELPEMRPMSRDITQSPPGDSNPQPLDYKSSALPIELGGRVGSVLHGRDGALEGPVAVAGVVGRRRGRLGLDRRVEAPLELAEDEPEQEVAPGRLDERATVAAEGGKVVAGRVVAVCQRDERPAGEVLGEREDRDRGAPARSAAWAPRWRRPRRTGRRSGRGGRGRRGTSPVRCGPLGRAARRRRSGSRAGACRAVARGPRRWRRGRHRARLGAFGWGRCRGPRRGEL